MSDNEPLPIALSLFHAYKHWLHINLEREYTYFQNQCDRVNRMRFEMREMELNNDDETQIQLFARRVWREEANLYNLEQEFEEFRDCILYDIANVDAILYQLETNPNGNPNGNT